MAGHLDNNMETPPDAPLPIHLAQLLFQLGDQRLYALGGLIVRRLSRQRPIFQDFHFEFYAIVP
jgi:hypothetical protein